MNGHFEFAAVVGGSFENVSEQIRGDINVCLFIGL
jgi:hypothetical protein